MCEYFFFLKRNATNNVYFKILALKRVKGNCCILGINFIKNRIYNYIWSSWNMKGIAKILNS